MFNFKNPYAIAITIWLSILAILAGLVIFSNQANATVTNITPLAPNVICANYDDPMDIENILDLYRSDDRVEILNEGIYIERLQLFLRHFHLQ